MRVLKVSLLQIILKYVARYKAVLPSLGEPKLKSPLVEKVPLEFFD
jgi:hypothetical protein